MVGSGNPTRNRKERIICLKYDTSGGLGQSVSLNSLAEDAVCNKSNRVVNIKRLSDLVARS